MKPTIVRAEGKPDIIKNDFYGSINFKPAPPSQFSVKPNQNGYLPRMKSNKYETPAKELDQYVDKIYPYDRSTPDIQPKLKQTTESTYKQANDKSVNELLRLNSKTNLDTEAIRRKTFAKVDN